MDQLRKTGMQNRFLWFGSQKYKLSPRRPCPGMGFDQGIRKAMGSGPDGGIAAMIDLVDQNIGRLIKNLKKRKVFDNTLFLSVRTMGCPFERTWEET